MTFLRNLPSLRASHLRVSCLILTAFSAGPVLGSYLGRDGSRRRESSRHDGSESATQAEQMYYGGIPSQTAAANSPTDCLQAVCGPLTCEVAFGRSSSDLYTSTWGPLQPKDCKPGVDPRKVLRIRETMRMPPGGGAFGRHAREVSTRRLLMLLIWTYLAYCLTCTGRVSPPRPSQSHHSTSPELCPSPLSFRHERNDTKRAQDTQAQ